MNIYRRKTSQAGATIVEFALVAFLFFLVMWAILEFGLAFYVVNSTQQLTRCIARKAVVLKPSQYDTAKQSCLMTSGAKHTWPFFGLNPGDLTNDFKVTYSVCESVNSDGSCQNPHTLYESDVSGGLYDDQFLACLGGGSHYCITDVIVSYDSSHAVRPIGLFAAWIGLERNLSLPPSTTTMPAESMGYEPGR